MHRFSDETAALARSVLDYALERVRMDPPPLDGPKTKDELDVLVGPTVTPEGRGADAALRVFTEVLASAIISADHPRNLAFVPCAPTEAAVLFDLVVSASCTYGGSWMEAAGAVWAENEALRWLCDLCGLPGESGGVFLSGGSAANLSGLVAARHAWLRDRDRPAGRLAVMAGTEAHASIAQAAAVMDADLVPVTTSPDGRLLGSDVAAALAGDAGRRVFALVATGGTTNTGVVDDLAGIAAACSEADVWCHVDAAYGGAALASPRTRGLFDGIEAVDSVTIDPHKWFFAPFDCAALLYRDPAVAREAHTQHAGYLDVLTDRREWNPSEYAYHLTRRARGLPFWFSLAAHGTDAYRDAVDATLDTAAAAAALIADAPHLELVRPPHLSVVLFRRLGWDDGRYHRWSEQVLSDGIAFVTPTRYRGETVLRFCIVNPRTTSDDIDLIVDTLATP